MMQRLSLVLLLLGSVGEVAGQNTIAVGSGKQLFVDKKFIRADSGIELRMNPPVKMGVVLTADRAWETGWISGAGTVLEDGGVYRMWYMAMPRVQSFEDDRFRLCYAESKDGVNWQKPNLGIYDWRGSKANNILIETSIENAGGVFIDPKAPPQERYKLVGILPKRSNPPEGDGLYVYTSADGLRWKLNPKRVMPFHSDTVNMAFFDTRIQKYVAFLRTWDPLRKVGRVETDDIMQPWPFDKNVPPSRIWKSDVFPASREIPMAFGYDEQDPKPSDHYTSAVVQYPWADDAYFMFPSAFLHFPPPPKSRFKSDGPLDIQMAISRDGKLFQRVERAPYIELGLSGSRDGGSLYMFIGMIRHGDELYQYYGGVRHTHGAFVGYPEIDSVGSIFQVVQRPDGFVSVNAPMSGGSFNTPPLRFEGNRLMLNLNGSAMGEVLVELQDEKGAPRKGYSFADCDPIHGNHLQKIVTWNGSSDLQALSSQPGQLAFKLRSVKLYAFQFSK